MAATDSQTAAVESEIAHLRGLDLDALRARWRSQTGRAAPSHLPKNLLLAYRAQAAALGELDKATARLLDRIADEGRSGKRFEVPVPDRSWAPDGASVGRLPITSCSMSGAGTRGTDPASSRRPCISGAET